MTLRADNPVRFATAAELPAIARFRYRALLSDPGFTPSPEMRADEALTDAWDALAVTLIVGDVNDIQATFRTVPLSRVVAQHGEQAARAAFGHLGLEHALGTFAMDTICVVGRLAIAPEQRGTNLVVDLLAAALHDNLSRDERLALADCSPPLVRLYQRLAGFYPSGYDFVDPIYGPKATIMGSMGDHQASAQAAIGYVAARFPDDQAGRGFRLDVQSQVRAKLSDKRVA